MSATKPEELAPTSTARRLIITVVVCVLVAAPAVWPAPEDDFPLSTYPMFTAEQGDVVVLDTVVAGDGRRLSPRAIGGTDEPVLAAQTVTRAIAAGPRALERLCREIAGRVGESVEVVTETHDAVALLEHGAPPTDIRVRVRCDP